MTIIAQTADAEEPARPPLATIARWTRFPPGFESRVARRIWQCSKGQSVPILTKASMDQAAPRYPPGRQDAPTDQKVDLGSECMIGHLLLAWQD
jgi:hypothetical protein